MLIDALELERDTLLEADLCIVGGGAAGITLAHELVGAGHSVLLLESGHLAYDQRVQELYLGEESGDLIEPETLYLASTRLRYLGGTTNHWNGWCRPLDAIDHVRRDWVPESGWPIPATALAPYFQRAAEVVEISPFDGEAKVPRLGRRQFFEAPADFETVRFHISPPTRFGQRYRAALTAAPEVRVLLNANVVEIDASADGDHATEVEIACLDGRRHRARAGAFVLATGAIENARLLLASRSVTESGLGNGRDLVGRYFMEHPLVRAGSLVAPGMRSYGRPFIASFPMAGGRHEARLALHLTEAAQRRDRLLKSTLVLNNQPQGQRPRLAAEVASIADPDGRGKTSAPLYGELVLSTEQVPNPQSRVALADELDRFGMPRTRLDWRLTDQDADSVRRTLDLLTRELTRRSVGRARVLVSRDEPWPGASGSPHQMGTTRMSADPGRGVVDLDCRVHGVDNLYVAGASVFPSSGATNPTLTIVAMALRLADHLREAQG